MSVTTGQNIKDLGDALFSAVSSTEKTRVDAALVRRTWTAKLLTKAANVDLSGTPRTGIIGAVPANLVNGIRIKAITLTTDLDVATAASNHQTITISKRDAAGDNSATVGTHTTNSSGGSALSDYVPAAFTLTAANTVMVAGSSLQYSYATGSATNTATDITLTVDYEEL